MPLHQFIISTVGGKPIKRSQDLYNLVQPARDVLAEGWPVFLKSAATSDNSIEFKMQDGAIVIRPGDHANVAWVERTLKEFVL